jgi:translation initiation factor IF-2
VGRKLLFYANHRCGILPPALSTNIAAADGTDRRAAGKEVVMKEIEVGKVTDYFAHIGVVAIDVTAEGIKVGDTLHFKGHTTDFTQKITSMQVEHSSVEEAPVGSDVGIKVKDRVRTHDQVFKVVE